MNQLASILIRFVGSFMLFLLERWRLVLQYMNDGTCLGNPPFHPKERSLATRKGSIFSGHSLSERVAIIRNYFDRWHVLFNLIRTILLRCFFFSLGRKFSYPHRKVMYICIRVWKKKMYILDFNFLLPIE